MDAEMLFNLSGPLTMTGWLLLIFAPLLPRIAQWMSGLIIPLILSLAYAVLIAVNWSNAEGGYDSLSNVMLLFDTPTIALAGWLHYLAFDLFVGAWEVRVAQREHIPHLLVLPCLLATFLFGPAGLILFLAIRYARKLAYPSSIET